MTGIDPVPPQGDEEEVFRATCRQESSYSVSLAHDVFAPGGTLASLLHGRRSLVVSTPTVWELYGADLERLRDARALEVAVLVLDATEPEKSIEQALRICAACHEHGLGRTDALVALGGGVCCDLVTVAASLVRRGTDYICIPTTLVGQIDAGVGIKGAVNFQGAKSYLGTFRAPQAVVVDPRFLGTAPRLTHLDGIAECVKIALINDPFLFRILEESGSQLGPHDPQRTRTVLRRAIARILEELTPNFFEDQTWFRRVDLGHTFSGLLEDRSGYRLSHGHAVSIDMALSASIATGLGLLPPADKDRILALLSACGLPTWTPILTPELAADALRGAALHRGGTPNLVVPHGIGTCGFLTDAREIEAVLPAAIASLLP